ncbi:hypothetical protein J1N35_018451 [Gossypium stocksii]|uniref:O-fucosyltransferase family protein n=1 Tax=Gossypium stocksii TaxID=47602 RepID=A0A9D4A664_9ROSI|nr:hypothetical protein J1N35_018451 [Gossypium stocksii]
MNKDQIITFQIHATYNQFQEIKNLPNQEIDSVRSSRIRLAHFESKNYRRKKNNGHSSPSLQPLSRLPSPAMLRSEGLCPLTPEEAVLMLAALGFNRKTQIYVAGAQIWRDIKRLAALTSLENLLSSAELEPFKNFSSQLAAMDFIACTAVDAFAP